MSYLTESIRHKTAAPTAGDYELARPENKGKLAEFARQQIAEYEAAQAAPVIAATTKLERSHAALLAEQRTLALIELKNRLCTQPTSEQEFPCVRYEGNLSEAEILSGIEKTFAEFKATCVDEADARMVAQFLNQNFARCNVLLPSVWSEAHAFLAKKMRECEQSFSAPAVEVPVQTDPYAFLSPLEREIFLSETWRTAMQSIVDSSGLTMGFEAQKSLFKYFSENTRRYGKMSVQSIRKAARHFWSDGQVGLLPEEQAEKAENAIWDSNLPATEARRALGIPIESNQQPLVVFPNGRTQ